MSIRYPGVARGHITDPQFGTIAPHLEHPGVTITWLRQAGFLVSGQAGAVLLDPFLTDLPGMLVPPPVTPEDVADVTAVLGSHEHIDHLDGPAWARMAAASLTPVFIAPHPVRDLAIEAGVPTERVIGARVGTRIELGPISIDPIPARHGRDIADAYTFGAEWSGGDHRYLGYVVRLDGVTIYHAGDTLLYDGMAERLAAMEVDLAFLPINGRDAARERINIVGNLDAGEAAALAGSIGLDTAVPMHYDAVPGNTASPVVFVDHLRRTHPHVSTLLPKVGVPFFYAARRHGTIPASIHGGER